MILLLEECDELKKKTSPRVWRARPEVEIYESRETQAQDQKRP